MNIELTDALILKKMEAVRTKINKANQLIEIFLQYFLWDITDSYL
jgi:hypothetical protein